MKKNIMIFGGTQFYNEMLVNGEYKVSKKKTVTNLKARYEVDNFSNSKLTTRTTLKTIDVFASARKYTNCILALGEADLIAGIEPLEFEKNLVAIINKLISYDINPILISLPKKVLKKYNATAYQGIIDNLSKDFNADYICNGSTTSTDNYVVSDLELRRTITRLCA